jgi:hypothetical protein
MPDRGRAIGRPPGARVPVRSLNVLALAPGFRYPAALGEGGMVQRVSTVAFEARRRRAGPGSTRPAGLRHCISSMTKYLGPL